MEKKLGFFEKKCQQIAKPKPKFDEQAALQQAAQSIEKLSGAKSLQGVEFLNRGFLRGYYVDVIMGSGKPLKVIAFVFPVINRQVMEFLVNAAKTDAVNGIMGFTDNVCIVKQYKI